MHAIKFTKWHAKKLPRQTGLDLTAMSAYRPSTCHVPDPLLLIHKMYFNLSEARMKVWGIKARCVSNKRSGVQTACMWLHAWTY